MNIAKIYAESRLIADKHSYPSPMETLISLDYTIRRQDIPMYVLGNVDPRNFSRGRNAEINVTVTFDKTGRTLEEYNELLYPNQLMELRVFNNESNRYTYFVLENPQVLTYHTYREYNKGILQISYAASRIDVTP